MLVENKNLLEQHSKEGAPMNQTTRIGLGSLNDFQSTITQERRKKEKERKGNSKTVYEMLVENKKFVRTT